MRFAPVFILLGFLTCSGCHISGERINGNGKMSSEERSIGNSPRIRVMGSINVVLLKGPNSLKVEGKKTLSPMFLPIKRMAGFGFISGTM